MRSSTESGDIVRGLPGSYEDFEGGEWLESGTVGGSAGTLIGGSIDG